jgi:hypothetical protein
MASHVPDVPRVADTAQPAEDYDVSQRADVAKLRKGAIGLGGVLFLTVTGSAPISAMLFNVPIMVGYGQGVGAPAAFIFAALVLVVFSVGYCAMARKKTTAGGFYSYISHGLGRELASAPDTPRWSRTRCSRPRWPAASPTS